MSRHHADWLSLIEVSGPFLSLPTLARAFPQGLDAHDPERMALLRVALAEWEQNRDSARPDPAIHQAWVRFVLSRILDLPDEAIAEGQAIPSSMAVTIPEHHETLRPDLLVVNPSREGGDATPRLLVDIVDAGQSLSDPPPDDAWQMPRAERMATLLAGTGFRLGLVTNGEQWMLVNATRDETPGYASWYATLWLDEPITLQAFRSLLGVGRFFGVADEDTLEALLTESAADQQEVTDQLGYQVRQAVEILIQTIDRIDKDRGRTLLRGVDEKRLYESALTVMMRLVFLFSAEERDMLKLGEDLYDDSYAVSTLRAQLRETADRDGEEVLERRYDAWSRLLATFRVVYGGVQHDQLSLPAYGGTLFDPDRFPFLEGRQRDTRWEDTPADPIPINNRAVLHLLEALQVLRMKASGGATEARTLSFRALDVEQIGHVYEGLLDHTAVRGAEPILGLVGGKDRVCEVPLPTLERLRQGDLSGIVAYLKEQTGRSEKALTKALEPQMFVDEQRLRAACDNDEDLFERVRPFAALLRLDTMEYPVVVTSGSVYVTQGNDRRSTGTHYTPRSLTEPIVRYTLEPVVYVGPAEGKPRAEWRLRPPSNLLALKVCDMTMGSGAFLVQACRYLAGRLVEAWNTKEQQNPGRVIISPEGDLSTGATNEKTLPCDTKERLILAQRLVSDRCLYGVDINEMAVEMAKLSLWLITLQKDRPFTFLDHALRCGDALLGVDLDQLTKWSLKRDHVRQMYMFEDSIHKALTRAVTLRRQISSTLDLSARETEQKERLLVQVNEATAIARLGGDLLVCVGLAEPKDQPRLQQSLLYEYTLAVAARQSAHESDNYSTMVTTSKHSVETELRELANATLGMRRPFHWELEFPEVFAAADTNNNLRGFDALVGNPPFANAIESRTARDAQFKRFAALQYPLFAQGANDYCLLFWARGLRHLLSPNGNYGWLSPTALLSDLKPWQKWVHDYARPTTLMLYPVDTFASARIRTTGYCGRRGQASNVLVIDRDSRQRFEEMLIPWDENIHGWFEATRKTTEQFNTNLDSNSMVTRDTCTLSSMPITIFAGCATGVAYDLVNFITDEVKGKGLRLVTTGAIDRYQCKWGSMTIRYLKKDYAFPRWPAGSGVPQNIASARNRQAVPKILIGGLTSVLECWLDETGEAGGVVSTWIIKLNTIDTPNLAYVVLTLLNSATFSKLYMNRYGGKSMSGKQTTIQRSGLMDMPCPQVVKELLVGRRGGMQCSLGFSNSNQQLAVCQHVGQILQTMLSDDPNWALIDKAGHVAVGLLYGRHEVEVLDDYQWWCTRSGRTPNSTPLSQLIDELERVKLVS